MSKTFRYSMSGQVATATLILLPLLSGSASAAAPQINTISLHGLRLGAATTFVVEGSDLLPDPRLLLGVPTVSHRIKGTATPNRIAFEVTLHQGATPAISPVRLRTRQ